MNGPKGGSDRWRYRELGSCMLVFLMGELVLTGSIESLSHATTTIQMQGKMHVTFVDLFNCSDIYPCLISQDKILDKRRVPS